MGNIFFIRRVFIILKFSLSKLLLLFIVMFIGLQGLEAQNGKRLSKPIPIDKTIKIGELENGLKYYLCRTKKHNNTASFYLAENIGSIVENEDERGFVHFVEHMAFNETEGFSDNKLISFLERHGLKRGQKVLSSVSLNETVFKMLDVDMSSRNIADSCLLVLNEWANGIVFRQDIVDREKIEIEKEFSKRNAAFDRITKEMKVVQYNNSQYSKRDVLGSLDVVNAAKAKDLEKFYKDWYRPDLQAVIVVGDINVKKAEEQIQRIFGALLVNKNGKSKPGVEIEDNDDVIYKVIADENIRDTKYLISVRQKEMVPDVPDMQSLKDDIMQDMFNMMMNSYITSQIKQDDILGIKRLRAGNIYRSKLIGDYSSYNLAFTPVKDADIDALENLLWVNNLIKNIDNTVMNNRFVSLKGGMLYRLSKMESNNNIVADKCLNNYLYNTYLPDLDYLVKKSQDIVRSISIKELAYQIHKWYVDKNLSIIVLCNNLNRFNVLSKEEIVNMLKVDGLGEEVVDLASRETPILLKEKPVPGKVVEEKKLKELDAELWTLSNGVKVLYKQSKRRPGYVVLRGESMGGKSVLDVKDLPSAEWICWNFTELHGIGEHDRFALKKILEDKQMDMVMELTDDSEVYYVRGDKSEIKTMMELVYMTIEKPRFDKNVFRSEMNKTLLRSTCKKDVDKEKERVWDSIRCLETGNNERLKFTDKDKCRLERFDDIERIYRDRFSDGSDWLYYIHGDISKKVAKKLAAEYLGAIKSSYRKEGYIDRDKGMIKGNNKKVIHAKYGKKINEVRLIYQYEVPNTFYNKCCDEIFSLTLRDRFCRKRKDDFERISIGHNRGIRSTCKFSIMSIDFSCKPEMMEELIEYVKSEIDDIVQNGISRFELKRYYSSVGLYARQNFFQWMTIYKYYMKCGKDISFFKGSYRKKVLSKIDSDIIRDYARKIMENCDKLEINVISE